MDYLFVFITFFVITLTFKIYIALSQARYIAKRAKEVPEMFKDVLPLADHRKAAAYSIAKLKLSIFDEMLHGVVVLGLTVFLGLQMIRLWVLGLYGFPTPSFWGAFGFDWWLGAGVMGLFFILGLPSSFYKQFKLEDQFGFNTMTVKLFVMDLLKGIVLTLLIGTPLLLVVLWVFYQYPAYWWLLAWGVLSAFQVLLMFIFPTWIAPLFNRFSPLADGSLKDRIRDLTKRVGVSAKEVFVVDGSKRSKHANAYFTGFGKNRRIVLYDTLLTQLNEDEIEAVLAHELGHLKHKHILKGIAWSLMSSLLLFLCLGYVSNDPNFYIAFLGQNSFFMLLPFGTTALILFSLVMPYVLFWFSPLGSWMSRRHEFEADRFAAKHSQADFLKSGLLKLYKENAASVVSDPLFVAFYASHPPIIQRLAALETNGKKHHAS
jgi:STE24 endopeptidase